MNRRVNFNFAWLVALASACFSIPAHAVILGIVTTPTTQHVASGQATSFTVTWVVSADLGPSVRSNYGAFGNSDITFARVNTVLSQAIPPSAGPVGPFSFTENVQVPASVSVAAQQHGLNSIAYSRDFVDGDNIPMTASVTIDFTSSLGAAFGITREALSFDDSSPVRIMQLNDKLTARAELTVTGTGLLQAVWEVASPPSTQGEPFYSQVFQVQQHMNAGMTQVLQSPSLSTSSPGLYLVRLHIIKPAIPFETPVIRYFVGEGRPGHGLPPAPISLVNPANMTVLASDAQFAWHAVKDAKIYQLEIYEVPQGNHPTLPSIGGLEQGPSAGEVNKVLQNHPLTGVLVPAEDLKTALSGTVRTHLLPGKRYFWRLLAIDESGVVIGKSPVREMLTP